MKRCAPAKRSAFSGTRATGASAGRWPLITDPLIATYCKKACLLRGSLSTNKTTEKAHAQTYMQGHCQISRISHMHCGPPCPSCLMGAREHSTKRSEGAIISHHHQMAGAIDGRQQSGVNIHSPPWTPSSRAMHIYHTHSVVVSLPFHFRSP